MAHYDQSPYHEKKVNPFNYYTFGNEFFRLLIDSKKKIVKGVDQLTKIMHVDSKLMIITFYIKND